MANQDVRRPRRRSPAVRREAATIVFKDRPGSFECGVRHQRERCAVLFVRNATDIPESFDLLRRDGTRQPCRRVWQGRDTIGVVFV